MILWICFIWQTKRIRFVASLAWIINIYHVNKHNESNKPLKLIEDLNGISHSVNEAFLFMMSQFNFLTCTHQKLKYRIRKFGKLLTGIEQWIPKSERNNYVEQRFILGFIIFLVSLKFNSQECQNFSLYLSFPINCTLGGWRSL